jgi:SAM-dependent methyltransferase
MKLFIYLSKLFFKQIKIFIKQLVKVAQFTRQKKFITNTSHRKRFKIGNDYPCLLDDTTTTEFDTHYLYHVAWACRKLVEHHPVKHVDISSSLNFCTNISALIPTEFYDFRPANIVLPNLFCGQADLLNLPFVDNSIESLSCMHVVEHIGLGRYGDALDYDGDLKAIQELKRVLTHGGFLYFVVPICFQPEIEFNAHRKYSFAQIKNMFQDFFLIDHSLITDNGSFIVDPTEADYAQQHYGCGCFIFRKK